MSKLLGLNIKYLRKVRNLTQDQLADKIGVNRAMIGSYEEGRAVPKLPALQILSHYFNVSIDNLVNTDLSAENNSTGEVQNIDSKGKNLRILTTLVDRNDKELITLVPVKASAGYAKGYADADFVETLPKFSLPFPELSKERTYRAFQISGDSMNTIPSGAYIICEYQQNWSEIKSGKTYIVVTKDDGVVYKRLYSHDDNAILLKSDNPEYAPYVLPITAITEVWKALGYISFSLPEPDELHMGKLATMIYKMQEEIDELKKDKKP